MFQIQTLFPDGNRDVGRNGDPYLRLDDVFRRAIKSFDSEMLLYPFEEQLHLPSLLVESANRDGRQCEVVGQKLERLACFEVDECDASQRLGITSARQSASESDVVIADQSDGLADWERPNQIRLHIVFGTRDKECPGRVQFVESGEVDVGLVHDVKRASLDVALLAEQIENLDVVHLAVADVNKTGNRTLQIHQRMELDRSFGGPKRRPIEQAQTQAYRRRIQRVDRGSHQRIQLRVRRLVGVKCTSRFDQVMCQVRKNFPRSYTIGVGQGVSRNRFATQTHAIKILALSTQIDLDIPQRFASGQLRKGENQKLIQATEVLHFVLRTPRCDHSAENLQRQIGHHLSEYQLSRLHDHPRHKTSANDDSSRKSDSNRGHAKNRIYS